MSNWPPEPGKLVVFRKHGYANNDYDNELFYGIVYSQMPDSASEYIIILIKYPNNYVDPFLERNTNTVITMLKKRLNVTLTLLKQGDVWNRVSSEDAAEIMRDIESDKFSSIMNIINNDEYKVFNMIKSQNNNTKKSVPTNMVSSAGLHDSIDLGGGNRSLNDKGTNNINLEYFLGKNNGPNLNQLFDDDSKIKMTDTDTLVYPEEEFRIKILHALNKKEDIPKERIVYPGNHNVALLNHILYREHEIDEGNKIINHLKKKFDQEPKLGGGIIPNNSLKLKIKNGYVHIKRIGINEHDVLRPDLWNKKKQTDVSKPYTTLKYYNYMLGKPIDYNILKHDVFLNDFQKSLDKDLEQLKEARLLLSQEYLIAVQPEPVYVMWFVEQLILYWYADLEYTGFVRKIKVLINTYRANNNEKYNQEHGVLPIIIVYPRYGYKAAKKVIDKLIGNFSLYFDKGWLSSHPTYFTKINSLFYYTNGNLDLKQYYRNVVFDSKETLKNEGDAQIYGKNYTTITGARDIFRK